MANDINCTVFDLMRDDALRKRIDCARYVTDQVGLPTLNDILAELAKHGRDPRKKFEAFQSAEGIAKIDDLLPGMQLPGIVTNITAFGAFVDIGVHQDGLVHLSQIADHYVKDPQEVLKVRQSVSVTVLAVDRERNRISLSLKKQPEASAATSPRLPAQPENVPAAEKKPQRQTVPVKSAQGKPADRNVPFNNPFVRAFGKN